VAFAAAAATPPGPAAPAGPRLAVDAAYSWLIPVEKLDAGEDLLARAGFRRARERLNWAEVEPRRGVFEWGKYDRSASAAQAAGVGVCQVFHNVPGWARSDHAGNRYPDDLRDAWEFGRAAAAHFAGRVQAWEVWNEADIREFSPETGDAYAAFLKAAYLGFKEGDPSVSVALVSLANRAGQFEEALFRNDCGRYFDLFNYHIYDQPSAYPARAQGHFDLLDRHGIRPVPIWLTEAGIGLPAPDGALSAADQQKQADFIPKSCVMSLACSTDCHFYFVFPHYLENGREFGVMDADLRPGPGYRALAAVCSLLGRAGYLGRVALDGPPGIEAHLFDNGRDETLVLWHEGGSVAVRPPAAVRGALVYDSSGVGQGPLGTVIEAGSSPRFVRAPRGVFHADGRFLAARHATGPVRPASALVPRILPPSGAVAKDLEAWRFRSGEQVPLTLEAYNFSRQPVTARWGAELPPGWSLAPVPAPFQIAPMGRESVHTSLLVGPGGMERRVLRFLLRGDDGSAGEAAPEAVLDPASLPAGVRAPLRLAPGEQWAANISGNGAMTVTPGEGDECRFTGRFDRPGDRWMYPTATFVMPRDWREFDALEFEVRMAAPQPGTVVRTMLVEREGSVYFTGAGLPVSTGWTRVVVPFASLAPGSFAPADPDGHLDLDRIAAIRIGCNATADQVELEVRHFSLVHFRE